MKTNIILCGDNLQRLSELPDNSVDLIYADPPFFSNRHYEIIWDDGAELKSFQDRWQGGINQYVRWMRPRLQECYRILKDTGSMYLHCDWHANAHLRIQMDNIFEPSNFQNEIIWEYYQGGKSNHRFGRKHDTILFYSKTQQMTFNSDTVRQPYAKSTIQRYKTPLQDGKIHKLNSKGKILSDVWSDLHSISRSAKERIGYPTQKPEALLKRIIEASSNKGDVVLDPFCGCGTTIAVAQQLGRRWIGIDVSQKACRMMAERLQKIGVEVSIDGMPETVEHLKSFEAHEFQYWVIDKVKGRNSNKKSGDMGIDGWTFTNNEPIQVKQKERIGRNVIDNFETAIRRANHTSGKIYAFSFAKGAYEEVARAENQDNLHIKLIPISELLDGTTVKGIERQTTMIQEG